MFILLRKCNKESGVVLLVMIFFVMCILIISAAMLSQSINQTNLEQQQIEQIQEAQLAKGLFWKAYANSAGSALTGVGSTSNTVLQNQWYVGTITEGSVGGGLNGTTQYNVAVTYK